MEIIRAGLDDMDIFCREKLDYGACCFYTDDKACNYYFMIKGREATLFANHNLYIDEAIDVFLFYSGFVTLIKDPEGLVLREKASDKFALLDISKIQPSQFYINERKLTNCKRWIKSQSDIMIPTSVIDGNVIALDGHTRLRAALDLGYKHAYGYADNCGEYITHFVEETRKRDVFDVSNMKILSDERYKVKWHDYCDEFFRNAT